MKEHPILFSGPMVKAIMEGRKTMTRRVIKPQPTKGETVCSWTCNGKLLDWGIADADGDPLDVSLKCPYGIPGDLLWVREAFATRPLPDGGEQVLFKEQFRNLWSVLQLEQFIEERGMAKPDIKWKPGMFLPRELSRLTLRVTAVRVERVQDISGMDAKREGVNIPAHMPQDGADLDWAKKEFALLWDSINAKRGYGWDANLWVWVVSFEKLKEVEG